MRQTAYLDCRACSLLGLTEVGPVPLHLALVSSARTLIQDPVKAWGSCVRSLIQDPVEALGSCVRSLIPGKELGNFGRLGCWDQMVFFGPCSVLDLRGYLTFHYPWVLMVDRSYQSYPENRCSCAKTTMALCYHMTQDWLYSLCPS